MIDYKNIADAVAKYSPLVASGLAEMNPVLGTVLIAITHAFNSDILSLPSVIASDPDAQSKIKAIEADHYDALIKYQDEDREYARQREMSVVKLTGKRDTILDFLAILVVIGFFVLCVINYFIPLRDDHVVIMLI